MCVAWKYQSACISQFSRSVARYKFFLFDKQFDNEINQFESSDSDIEDAYDSSDEENDAFLTVA